MKKLSNKEHAKIRNNVTVNAGISAPGSRNAWYMDVCPTHGETSHQTPFGCEKCQQATLEAQGLVR